MTETRYCRPRRRVRHRDKVAVYAVLLAVYVGIQLVTGAATTAKPSEDTDKTLSGHVHSVLLKAKEHGDKFVSIKANNQHASSRFHVRVDCIGSFIHAEGKLT